MSNSQTTGRYLSGETIAALSSRYGKSPRSLLRLSGPQAIQITTNLFQPANGTIQQLKSQTALTGWLKLNEPTKCPCKIYLFLGPKSYTGEDLIEYHLPGGPALVQMAMATLITAGARMAEPGEFTLRAFLAGKLDLAQAEAVAAIIASQTDAQLRAANSLADGLLSRAVEKIQKKLAELISKLEANIDFVDQDIDFVGSEEAAKTIETIQEMLDGLLTQSLCFAQLDSVPRVVLAGWANVGKSTLLNALSGRSRAIVSGLAGTTRDLLMAPMKVADTTVLLTDAAGLGDLSLDEVGKAAQEAAIAAVRRAELTLYVLDAATEIDDGQWQTLEMLSAVQTLIVVNKIDLLSENALKQVLQTLRQTRQETLIATSAKTGKGLDELRNQIREHLTTAKPSVSQAELVLSSRAQEGLKLASDALARAKELLPKEQSIEEPELVVLELYEANADLGAITGQISSQDVLEDIFSRFCVGK